jgi:hypothetical protein
MLSASHFIIKIWPVVRKSLKATSLDGIPSFIVKGCSDIFVPLLTHIFNPSVASETLPSLWKETATVPVLMFTFQSLHALTQSRDDHYGSVSLVTHMQP